MKVLCVTLNPAIDLTVSLDVLNLGEVNRAHTQQTDAAGKGLNSAQILADLGADALAAGFLGAENDALFRQLFADRATERTKNPKLGALGDEFMRVAGATRTNIKLVDGAGTGVRTTDVNGAGFQISADDTARLSQHLCALASQADAVLVAGSLPKGFALNDFKDLLENLLAVNSRLVVDVSGEALKVALGLPLWLIKPNDDELFEVFGKPCRTLDEQAKLLDEAGANIQNVVISMGAKGVHWLQKTPDGLHAYQATPPKMTVKSTVGAGDTLVAGMMFGLLGNLAPTQVLAQATALAAHAVSIIGFKAADDDRLRTLLAQVEVLQVDV